ncbi:MAG TPA: histidine kinase [Actinospica sp.]|nr:histidine kinase [Actinospica sp.]
MFMIEAPPTLGRWAGRHTRGVLRAAIWGLRVVGLAFVGVLTFLTRPSAPGGAGTQTVCYIVMCIGIALWAVADVRAGKPGRLERSCLPIALGLVTVAGCLGASAGGTGDAMIALPIAAVMAAGGPGPYVAATVCALGVLMLEIGGIAFGQGVGTLLGYPLLLAVALLVGRNREAFRVQAEQSAALLAQHEALRSEQRRADVLDERARIAREIHDVLAHSLGALGIQIQLARAVLTDQADIDKALVTLATAQRMASDGLSETRRAVLALRSDTLPLPEELARAAAEHGESHHIVVHCETSGEPRHVPPDATVALLRAARESLVNAAKHAPGQPVWLDLAYRVDGVRLTVANPLGASAENQGPVLHTIDGGYGLTGMGERLRLLRGTLEAGVRGERWVVVADLPLEPAGAPTSAPTPTPASTPAPGTANAPASAGASDPQKADR